MLGRAIADSTVARTGLASGSTHAFQTPFMPLKSELMSLSHIVACRARDLDVPASASKASTFSKQAAVCDSISSPASAAVCPEV
eukprot:CAMPEP_0115869970 /NCGR_PEP_ID=MMETSP0287-20121206/22080_2 /TAXON_ID=412157 /ORGANISM="Chrysochromulina rotalis, Strain UIO044" /LENGTH=83 /DNA_ID=CAMNT_0003324667 /DNA_START=190 /DNA_END=441 /DNA_ORIENTATION=-